MSQKLSIRALDAGEIAEQFYGRSDVEKYPHGLALAENWFVNYRGGLSTRPGTEFCDYVKDDDLTTKYVPFRYAPNLANTYVILFGDDYVRFIQDGAYVLESGTTITDITKADPGVVTAGSHGLSDGDWVNISDVGGMTEVNGLKTFIVANKTSNTFELTDFEGNNVDTQSFTTYTSGGTVARIYTVSSPYGEEDLGELRAYQIRDYVRLTHPDYDVRNLTRSGATSWAFSAESRSAMDFLTTTKPTCTIKSAGGGATSGEAECIYCVTAVDVNGQESLPTYIQRVTQHGNFLEDSDLSMEVSWTYDADAQFYRVYRSRVVNFDGGITKGDALGLIAETFGTKITDEGIIPDFTRTPPRYGDPMAPGAVTHIQVTAGGSGYDDADVISVSGGGGSGFRGELIVVGGAVVAVKIINPGSGYSSASASVSPGGSGATFSVTLSDATGTYPYCSTVFQQRQIYAGTDANPLDVYGSVVGYLSNFSEHEILIDSDAFNYELDAEVVVPIRWVMATKHGLLAGTKEGIWLLSGGQEPAITPTNVLADPHPSAGSAALQPLRINTSVVYLEDGNRAVRLLKPQQGVELIGQDISILANHLVDNTNPIESWCYAAAPYSIVWAQRDDGTFVSATISEEHGLFAWCRHSTAGIVHDMVAIEEGTEHSVYLMVERYVNGTWRKYIERMKSREFDNVEDAWCVDSGLKTSETNPDAILTPGALTGDGVTFTASASVFASGDVGKIIRGGGGKGEIASYVSGTEITVDITRDFTKATPQNSQPIPIPSGDWSMDATFTEIAGLDHLEGETVKVLLDGKVQSDGTVSSGKITVNTGSRAIVGKKFRAKAQTLPIVGGESPIDDARKRPIGVAVRVHETAGLQVGETLDTLYEGEERVSDNLNTAITLYSQYRSVLIRSTFDENGQVFFVQDQPLPATIIGFVMDMGIGDDNR